MVVQVWAMGDISAWAVMAMVMMAMVDWADSNRAMAMTLSVRGRRGCCGCQHSGEA